MTDRTPDAADSPSSDLRAALTDLIAAIDQAGGPSDTDELRRVAADQLNGLDNGAEEHEGPFDSLRDALHRFETVHPGLTAAINNVSHYLSALGI